MFTRILKPSVILCVLFVILETVDCDTMCNCKPLKQCPSFIRYLKTLQKPLKLSTVEFIRSKKCGYQDGFPKICCLNTYSSTQVPRRKSPPKKQCDTSSECVILKNCAPFMDFLSTMEKPLKPTVVEFLRHEECGFEHNFPKVCCRLIPTNLPIFNRPTSKPRTPINFLSSHFESEDDREMVNLFQTIVGEKFEIPKKTEALNMELAIMKYRDFVDSFDLILRKKRSGVDTFPDIEIR